MRPSRYAIVAALCLLGTTALNPCRAQMTNVVLEHFETSGELVFTGTPDIAYFQVQWAPAPGGSWTTFTGQAGINLDLIPYNGQSITAAVPMVYRVVGTLPPEGMVFVPAGTFSMGDAYSEGSPDELPVHDVHVDHFFIDRYEVTKDLWDEVYTWATNNNYQFDHPGAAKSNDHPVIYVKWFDCVKWSNARSEMEGLTPCYTSSGGVYRTGSDSFVTCDFSQDGYRLPTEAEWEKAARGGAPGLRFPWSEVALPQIIAHSRANYFSDNVESYDASATTGLHPDYSGGGVPNTSPVGSFDPNAYGIHDMAGNASEWCWDLYDSDYYDDSPVDDPTGPPTPIGLGERVLRGGYYSNKAIDVRVANRFDATPGTQFVGFGFRCAKGL